MSLTSCKLKSAWGTTSVDIVREQSAAPSRMSIGVMAAKEKVCCLDEGLQGCCWKVCLIIVYIAERRRGGNLFPSSRHTHTRTQSWAGFKHVKLQAEHVLDDTTRFGPAKTWFHQLCVRERGGMEKCDNFISPSLNNKQNNTLTLECQFFIPLIGEKTEPFIGKQGSSCPPALSVAESIESNPSVSSCETQRQTNLQPEFVMMLQHVLSCGGWLGNGNVLNYVKIQLKSSFPIVLFSNL